jgi:hypothetical protein
MFLARMIASTLTMTLHENFDTRNAYETAINRVIQSAVKNVCIFDFNLADSGYNSPQRIQLLHNFLRLGSTNRLTIILHETDYLTKYCPRMMNLLSQFSHAIRIEQTGNQPRQRQDSFVVADSRHCVRRFHYDHFRGQMAWNDDAICISLVQQFDELDKNSDSVISATTLGL